jgi:hypothetical protein
MPPQRKKPAPAKITKNTFLVNAMTDWPCRKSDKEGKKKYDELADKNSKQKKLSSDDSCLFLTHFPSKRKRYTAEQKPLKLQRSENRNPVTSRRQARRHVRLGVLINQLAKLLLQTRMMLSLNARDQRYML